MLQRYEAAPTPPKILSHHQHMQGTSEVNLLTFGSWKTWRHPRKNIRKRHRQGKSRRRRNMQASLQVQCCREQNRKLRSCTEHRHHQKWTPSGKTKRVHSRSFLNFVGIRIRQMPPALQENPTETGWPHRLQQKRLGLLPPWNPKWTWDGAASHPTSGKMQDVPTMFPRPLWPGISLGILVSFATKLCLPVRMPWLVLRPVCVLLGCLGLFCCQNFQVLEVRQTYRRPLRQNQGTQGPGVMHQVHRPFLNICRGGSSSSVSMNAKVQSPLSMTACSTTTMSNAKISFVSLKSPLAAESTACPRIQATSFVFPRFSAK